MMPSWRSTQAIAAAGITNRDVPPQAMRLGKPSGITKGVPKVHAARAAFKIRSGLDARLHSCRMKFCHFCWMRVLTSRFVERASAVAIGKGATNPISRTSINPWSGLNGRFAGHVFGHRCFTVNRTPKHQAKYGEISTTATSCCLTGGAAGIGTRSPVFLNQITFVSHATQIKYGNAKLRMRFTARKAYTFQRRSSSGEPVM